MRCTGDRLLLFEWKSCKKNVLKSHNALHGHHYECTDLSLSPSHLETRSDEDTEKKVELFASVATAFARYDLPVPGGWGQ